MQTAHHPRNPIPHPSLREAYAHCERVARSHYENFPVASRLLPSELRPHLCAVYAFARAADDFADEKEYEGERLAKLDDWESRLDACLEGEVADPLFAALGHTIRAFGLPDVLFRDLLKAFRYDVGTRRHETFEDLLSYCRLSANPVGRIVLGLFGIREERQLQSSDAVCSGLQLANFWQDIALDLQKGRIYLPESDMRRFGLREEDLRGGRVTPAFAELLRLLIDRTRDLFRRGLPLVAEPLPIPGGPEPVPHSTFRLRPSAYRRLSFELRLTWLGGMRILEGIEKAGCDVFSRRPELRRGDWVGLLYRAWRFRADGS